MQKDNLPNHIAIIPDGNRRWAKENNLEPWDGHDAGANNIEALVQKGFDIGIKNMSFWGSSLENLQKRPLKERQALLRIYKEQFGKLLDNEDIHKNEAKINIIGRWEEQFPEVLKKIVRKVIDKTKDYDKYTLNFFLAYSGDDDIIEAAKNIVKKYKSENDITGEVIKENLMTKELPAVDYLIRTGGEPHLSAGFLMWDIANAQLYFSQKYFPDFDDKEFQKAIEEYQRRERRLGK